jgi:undecaprenyl-diphosphatase
MRNIFKSVIDWVIQTDNFLLERVKGRSKHSRLSRVMRFLSHPPGWRYVAGLILLGLLIFGSNEWRWLIGIWLVVILISDQTCNLLKALCRRVRPDGMRNTEGSIWRKLGYYSFPSSHAANTFATAMLVSHWVPIATIPLFTIGLLVSYSRVYRNNHYPSDILAGVIIGIIYSYIAIIFGA